MFKKIFHLIEANFLWMILFSYLVAAFFPSFGLSIRDTSFGNLHWFDNSTIKISLPLVMLSLLLFNAGLSIKSKELINLLKHPTLLILGLAANLVVPILFIFIVSKLMFFWHNPDEVQNILVGLALVASMPIAASSTAWAQKSKGNLSLSLSLVVFSTILSPLSTPIGLKSIGFITTGNYSENLHRLAMQGTNAFLTISVLIPTILGISLHFLIGEKRLEKTKVWIKFLNIIDLLLLNYSNASVVLPKILKTPDFDFLFAIFIIVSSLCLLTFLSGALIAKCTGSGVAEKSSLMFGLGMNNNGTGLVLASLLLANHPLVTIPIIFYNLVQQIIAGVLDSKLSINTVRVDNTNSINNV